MQAVWSLECPCDFRADYNELYIQGNTPGRWWKALESQKEWYDKYCEDGGFVWKTSIVDRDEGGVFQIHKQVKRYFYPNSPPGGLLLRELLSLYKYPFLGSATEYVSGLAKSSLTDITSKTRLVVSSQLNIKDVQDHLKYRYLVYFGTPAMQEKLNLSKMKKLLGYEYSDVEQHRPLDAKVRYGILGWSPLRESLHRPVPEAWFLHTWGVNMNEEDVDKLYVNKDMNKYYQLLTMMFRVLEQSTLYVHNKTKKPVLLRVPGLGFGAWATQLTEMNQKDKVMKEFQDRLLQMHHRHKEWLQIRHPLFPTHQTLGTIGGKWEIVELNHDPFGDNPDRKETTILKKIPTGSTTVIVNAWDNGSLIGNGGSLDNTLDGLTVAGGSEGFHSSELDPSQTLGFQAQNGSVLHNLVFNPKLLNPKKWIKIPKKN